MVHANTAARQGGPMNSVLIGQQAGRSCSGEFYQASEIHFVYPFDPIIYYFLFAAISCMLYI
jgi:hypothetical protein